MEVFLALLDLIFVADRVERERRAEDRARTRARRDALRREFEAAEAARDARNEDDASGL